MNHRRILRFAVATLAALAAVPLLDASPRLAQSQTSDGPNPAERRLAAAARANMDGSFRFRPSWATVWGAHEYDSLLEDRSRGAIDREVARLRSALAELQRIDAKRLSDSARVDYDLFESTVEGQIFDLTEIRRWENDPSAYGYGEAILALISRTYGTPEDRLRAVIARLGQVPRLLRSARKNLRNPPQMFTGFAIEEFSGMGEFLDRDVPLAFATVRDADLLQRYDKAKREAQSATRKYVAWLQNDLMPRSNGSFVLGPEKYRKKLRYDEMVDLPLDDLLRAGERELHRLQSRFNAAALKMNPSIGADSLIQLMRRDHPTADSLIPYVDGLLEGIRSYCISSRFIEIPSDVRCLVRPTPEFQAQRSFASLDAPGPFEREAVEAYYYITPPNPSWDSARVEQHLQGYSYWSLPSVSIHEAYPGHYVHFLHAKLAPSIVRKTMGSGSFAEGWGLYTEEAMVDHGYGRDDPRIEIGMLRWALVRACRFQVGLRVHTKNMSLDEAIAFFMKHSFMERANAEREAYRAAFDPTYIIYTLGALQIRKLRDEMKKAAKSLEFERAAEIRDRLFKLEDLHLKFGQ